MRFTWDARKVSGNLKRHGVSFEAASACSLIRSRLPNPDHSVDERRFVTFGMSSDGQLPVIAHTEPPSPPSRRKSKKT